jgi:hypothetical protein
MDWSSFVPDLIVGVVTGALVGLALYLFEHSRRRADEHAQALHGWSLVAPRIERISYQPLSVDTSNYAGFGSSVQRIRDIADGYPLELWQRVLGREDIGALLDLLAELDALEVAAEKAEGMLATAAYFRGLDSEVGGIACIVARAQSYGHNDQQMAAMMAPPNDFMLKFVDVAKSFREHPGFAKSEARYLESRGPTNDALVAYANAVRMARAEAFQVEVERGERHQLARDLISEPIKTIRRVARNRRARKADEGA